MDDMIRRLSTFSVDVDRSNGIVGLTSRGNMGGGVLGCTGLETAFSWVGLSLCSGAHLRTHLGNDMAWGTAQAGCGEFE